MPATLTRTGPAFKRGDMWSAWDEADLFLITTNAVVTADGRLVMGAGIAKEARDRFPGVDRAFGKAVSAHPDKPFYGLLVSERWPVAKLGAFQTKILWQGSAKPELIKKAVAQLTAWCKRHPTARVHLNMPGTGHGGLRVRDVKLLLAELPESVTVWQKS